MKFEDYKYERPDLEQFQNELREIKDEIENAQDYETVKAAFKKQNVLHTKYNTMNHLASVRHTIDTRDEFYKQEDEFYNEATPLLAKEMNGIQKALMNSPWKEDLKRDFGEIWFKKVEFALKAFDEQLIADMQEENRLVSAHENLIASAQIPFDGEVYTLASLDEKMNDSDREVRERAHKAYWGWFEENEEALGEIYDKMVKVRTRMGQKLGYSTYHPLGYLIMSRLDYTVDDVAEYRKNVLKDVVPVAEELYEKQAERLGFGPTLPVWDEKVEFLEGNARPKGNRDELVAKALEMYQELDPETGEFFQFMVDHNLLDLDSKPGKAGGGYCTYFPEFRSPFIFANFNHTQHDAEVLTHEAGHAFQVYSSRDVELVENAWPTMESAEIHSMSMEFFTWPWMNKFFEDETEKYKYTHLAGAVKFIPYGVLVDHFQHEVYAHPEWSHADRMACWRELEKQYLPHKDYTGVDILERGGWWLRQNHIFQSPFYYIDYTLAQVCALQFWKRMIDEDPNAFED
ncbi:MAG: M3 family oligoendopeptidase, partial [Erysipelotrichaceae bacterium]|nr:M3 family oligoendopeptidase [Erysipelotrichaceae bacterium]